MFDFIKNPILIGSAVIIGLMSLTIWYLKSENDTLHQNIATEKANTQIAVNALEEQKESLFRVEAARANDQKVSNELAKANRKFKADAAEMNQIFKDHDLSNLSLHKPKLIENRVNKGTKRVGKLLEEITRPIE